MCDLVGMTEDKSILYSLRSILLCCIHFVDPFINTGTVTSMADYWKVKGHGLALKLDITLWHIQQDAFSLWKYCISFVMSRFILLQLLCLVFPSKLHFCPYSFELH